MSCCIGTGGFNINARRDFARQSFLQAQRYGPPPSAGVPRGDDNIPRSNSGQDSELNEEKTAKLRDLIYNTRQVKDPQHIPSLLTRNIDLVFSFSPPEISASLDWVRNATKIEEGEDALAEVEAAIDLIFSFAQDFSEEAALLHDVNRRLLGKIIKTMSSNADVLGSGKTPERREEALDELLAQERDNLTPGFLRHLAAECERIENAPTMTPESIRLIESLRVIQARVVDEVGRSLGEPAQVIMQLLGYDTKIERIAVLEAGLVVRGIDFAKDLLENTSEALEGFQKVVGGADPELVERVREIHERTAKFIDESSEECFQ